MKTFEGIEKLLISSENLLKEISFPDNVRLNSRYNDVYQKVITSIYQQIKSIEQEKIAASKSRKRKLRKQIVFLYGSLKRLQ